MQRAIAEISDDRVRRRAVDKPSSVAAWHHTGDRWRKAVGHIPLAGHLHGDWINAGETAELPWHAATSRVVHQQIEVSARPDDLIVYALRWRHPWREAVGRPVIHLLHGDRPDDVHRGQVGDGNAADTTAADGGEPPVAAKIECLGTRDV